MTRANIYRHEIDYGEDATWTAPAGAAKWLAWTKTPIMSIPDWDNAGGGARAYGGSPPGWIEAGGFDIDGDAVIETETDCVDPVGLAPTATGATVGWAKLVDLGGGVASEVIQFAAYDGAGKAMRVDRFAIPAPSATDADVIAAQERTLLGSLLWARDRAAGAGGVRKLGAVDGSGDEYESLAALDARIAACRARIAWFEEAARGNILPRMETW